MSKDPSEFLRALFEALSAVENGKTPKPSDAHRRKLLMSVSDSVDLDLVNALNQWLHSQNDEDKPFKNGQLTASVAYLLASIMVTTLKNENKPESMVCDITEIYADYVHNVAHAMFRDPEFGK